ncbi:SDR family oxidoreductase [Naumannella halotolerans]|uniref:3-oxoacyl-[acyl-carrier protein] reductase n=1 Tax=Naumannella halotolerans TaxID=993414 RepID=A0A4R7J7Y5_9ACTN|nr:SDR family oxidoreductase [Naumannella halotolerans]TDT32876.1 3-oxoacyl-[acyl-carrier protein] reductase [Naumannella halotolerans]
MDLGLTDKVFVVTAASGGLGRASAAALVAEGAKVVLVARRAEVLAEAVAEFGDGSAVALSGDLGDPDLPGHACRLALDTWGRLDGALISVGGPPAGAVLEMSEKQWTDAFDSVFLAALRTVRAVVAAGTADDLAIGLVLSTSARLPLPGMAISNGLRPGLGMLVKQLADELGPDGTRVLGLLPGSIDTERMIHLLERAADPQAARKAGESAIPLRRYGRPEEFGRVAAFALSPAGSYLSGSLLPVDGGAMRTV